MFVGVAHCDDVGCEPQYHILKIPDAMIMAVDVANLLGFAPVSSVSNLSGEANTVKPLLVRSS